MNQREKIREALLPFMERDLDVVADAILEALKEGSQPVDAVPLKDMVDGIYSAEYGLGLFATRDCVKQLYTLPSDAQAIIAQSGG